MSNSLAAAATASSLVLVTLIILFVSRNTGLDQIFFYHPVLMIFLGESKRKSKVAIHFWMQIVSTAMFTLGFIAIVLNKVNKCAGAEGPCNVHFRTWHSWVGLCSLITCWIQSCGGFLLYYKWPKLILSTVINIPQDITLKKLHRMSGAVGFVLGILGIVLGTYSTYAVTLFPSIINILICALSVFVMLTIIPLNMRFNLPQWLQ